MNKRFSSNSQKVSPFPGERQDQWSKKKLIIRVGTLFIVFFTFLFGFYTYHLYQNHQGLVETEEKYDKYTQKEEQLQKEIEQWKSQDYLERVARRELGLVNPGETVIILED